MIVLKRTINWDGGTALTNVATFCQYAHISIGTPIFISVRINVIEMQDKQMESCKIVSNIFLFSSEPFSLKRLNLFRFECTHGGALRRLHGSCFLILTTRKSTKIRSEENDKPKACRISLRGHHFGFNPLEPNFDFI